MMVEASEASELDCVRDGYPCSLADADPAALVRVQTLLQEIWDVRHDGTLDDVRTYLENQPDVVQVGGNYRYVSFRVDGMSPAIFDDVTLVHDPLPEESSPAALRPPRNKFDTRRWRKACVNTSQLTLYPSCALPGWLWTRASRDMGSAGCFYVRR
jgi:hypothetical protein